MLHSLCNPKCWTHSLYCHYCLHDQVPKQSVFLAVLILEGQLVTHGVAKSNQVKVSAGKPGFKHSVAETGRTPAEICIPCQEYSINTAHTSSKLYEQTFKYAIDIGLASFYKKQPNKNDSCRMLHSKSTETNRKSRTSSFLKVTERYINKHTSDEFWAS